LTEPILTRNLKLVVTVTLEKQGFLLGVVPLLVLHYRIPGVYSSFIIENGYRLAQSIRTAVWRDLV